MLEYLHRHDYNLLCSLSNCSLHNQNVFKSNKNKYVELIAIISNLIPSYKEYKLKTNFTIPSHSSFGLQHVPLSHPQLHDPHFVSHWSSRHIAPHGWSKKENIRRHGHPTLLYINQMKMTISHRFSTKTYSDRNNS